MIIPSLDNISATAHGRPLTRVTPVPGHGYAVVTSDLGVLRASLSSEQAAVFDSVISSEDGDILVLAGPGSGKTKTLVASIAGAVATGVDPAKIIAISFTNNSAAELKVRLTRIAQQRNLPALHRVHVSTFHSWIGQLDALTVTPWSYPPVNLQTPGFALALHLLNPDSVKHTFTPAEVAAAERHLEGSETFDAMWERDFNRINAEGKNNQAFENLKTATKKLSSEMPDQQIGSFGSLMRAGPDLVATLPNDAVSWLFVDEAQDLNAPQSATVAALKKQTGCRVFAIADDDQGIYKFRGASNQFLDQIQADHGTRTFQLTRNFRSTTAIVEACVKWISPNWNKTRRAPKALHSTRCGLPVVLLSANQAEDRAEHAKIIMMAARNQGLVNSYGEIAVLSYSAQNLDYDAQGIEDKLHSIQRFTLPDEVFNSWIEKLEGTKKTGEWHHAAWLEFLTEVTAAQKDNGDPILGHPGLNELYNSLEVFRRLKPDDSPTCLAKALKGLVAKPFRFDGGIPDPDYGGDKINSLSFHSSKGMEFPVVWVTGGDFTLSISKRDEEQGQPNLFDFIKDKLTGKIARESIEQHTRDAAILEKRRLLYVAMSRASDLLLISLNPKSKEKEFQSAIQEMTNGLSQVVRIENSKDANAFAESISSDHRNPHWSAPSRYRVESFTSLTRQPAPGEIREVEIPRDREFPRPQNEAAMIGDHFHRIMHLLGREPSLIDQRRRGTLTDAELVSRVSTRSLPDLEKLLCAYFGDETNRPWDLLRPTSGHVRSEVPFSHVSRHPITGEAFLLKGFIDLVSYDSSGNPTLILDYKTGIAPEPNSETAARNREQLKTYCAAIASSHSIPMSQITSGNYYMSKDGDPPVLVYHK